MGQVLDSLGASPLHPGRLPVLRTQGEPVVTDDCGAPNPSLSRNFHGQTLCDPVERMP